jgi:hypothetical protein
MVDSLKVLDPNRPIREAEVSALVDYMIAWEIGNLSIRTFLSNGK